MGPSQHMWSTKNPGIKNAGSIVFVGKERGLKWVKRLKGDLRLKPQAMNISRAKCRNDKKDHSGSELITLEWKFEIYIPRNETARPRTQFLHSCTYLWATYILPQLVLGRPIVEIYKSLTDTWMWKLGDRTL